MKKKWIFLTGLFVCLLAAAWLYYNYQKPRAGVAAKEAAYTITATELYNAFATNEAAANEKYNGKIITVNGIVTDVTKSEDALLVILKGSESGGVSCSFTNNKHTIPRTGSEVTIKGRCTGFLMDVNLVDAVLIQ